MIELILVIVLVGVLGVVVAPRFASRDGFDNVALRNQALAILRHMQLRAMQDTRSAFCHQINFTASPSALGPPTNNFANGNAAATCATNISTATPNNLHIDSATFDSLGASLSATDDGNSITTIGFNSLGQPITNAGNCSNDCRLTITTDSAASVCVNVEGYIRGC